MHQGHLQGPARSGESSSLGGLCLAEPDMSQSVGDTQRNFSNQVTKRSPPKGCKGGLGWTSGLLPTGRFGKDQQPSAAARWGALLLLRYSAPPFAPAPATFCLSCPRCLSCVLVSLTTALPVFPSVVAWAAHIPPCHPDPAGCRNQPRRDPVQGPGSASKRPLSTGAGPMLGEPRAAYVCCLHQNFSLAM